jgi:hypothetical protein
MHRLGFGCIKHLVVQDHEPRYGPATRVTRDIIFNAGEPRPAVLPDSCVLKNQVRELFALIDRIGTGEIKKLWVRNGLPFRARIEEEINGRLGD